MKKVKMAAVAAGLAALCGCATGPVAFKASSAPVPAYGYTVMGSDVTGTSDQIWVFGFGGSLAFSLLMFSMGLVVVLVYLFLQ